MGGKGGGGAPDVRRESEETDIDVVVVGLSSAF